MDGLVDLVNVQMVTSRVNCFLYSAAVIIATAYPSFVPSGNAVCIVLMEASILANSFIVFSIDIWVSRPVILVVVFVRIVLMVSSLIVIVVSVDALRLWSILLLY